MIDWQRFAENNNLSIEQYKKEILTAAAVIGVMDVDCSSKDCLRFTCSDEAGKIEVLIRRAGE